MAVHSSSCHSLLLCLCHEVPCGKCKTSRYAISRMDTATAVPEQQMNCQWFPNQKTPSILIGICDGHYICLPDKVQQHALLCGKTHCMQHPNLSPKLRLHQKCSVLYIVLASTLSRLACTSFPTARLSYLFTVLPKNDRTSSSSQLHFIYWRRAGRTVQLVEAMSHNIGGCGFDFRQGPWKFSSDLYRRHVFLVSPILATCQPPTSGSRFKGAIWSTQTALRCFHSLYPRSCFYVIPRRNYADYILLLQFLHKSATMKHFCVCFIDINYEPDSLKLFYCFQCKL